MLEDHTKEDSKKIDCCFYCGDTALELTRDHVRPVSYNSPARHYNPKDVVPCCSECNTLLGNYPAFTVEERAEVLIEKISKKYKKVLACSWTQEELDQGDFGRYMRSKIQANVNMKSWVVNRLENLSKTAVSMYDRREISHLRGLTTRSKVMVYHMLTEFLRGEGSHKDFVARWSDMLDVPKKEIESILSEKAHTDVAITIKLDRGWPVDYSVKKLRQIIKKGNKNR